MIASSRGDQITKSKPAPGIYLQTADRLGVDPTRCLALEDSNAGVLSAASAGMRVFMVPDLLSPSEEAPAAADKVVASLEDVWGELEGWI